MLEEEADEEEDEAEEVDETTVGLTVGGTSALALLAAYLDLDLDALATLVNLMGTSSSSFFSSTRADDMMLISMVTVGSGY